MIWDVGIIGLGFFANTLVHVSVLGISKHELLELLRNQMRFAVGHGHDPVLAEDATWPREGFESVC